MSTDPKLTAPTTDRRQALDDMARAGQADGMHALTLSDLSERNSEYIVPTDPADAWECSSCQ